MSTATEVKPAVDRDGRAYQIGSVVRIHPCDCPGTQTVVVVTEISSSETFKGAHMFIGVYHASFSTDSYFETGENEIIADPPVYVEAQ